MSIALLVEHGSRPGDGDPAELDFSGVTWEKSPFSGGSDNCVEFGGIGGLIALRDSKRPEQTPLVFDRDEIAAMIAGAKSGSFDHLSFILICCRECDANFHDAKAMPGRRRDSHPPTPQIRT